MKKRAVISGSTDGIGKACAKLLCKYGYSITLISKNLSNLQKVKDELLEIEDGDHNYIVIDFNLPKSITEVLKNNWADKSEQILLINNTGGPTPKNLMDCNIEDFQTTFNRYLLSFHEMTSFFVPKMKEKRWGRIINILGTSVLEPIPTIPLASIKSATEHWSKILASELGSFNITVNNIHPGPTDTKELHSIVNILSAKEGISKKEYLDKLCKQIPLNRIATVNEIAEGAFFLCSDKASFITGSSIKIDGGYTI